MKTCHLIALISVIASSVMAQGTVASSSIMGYTKVTFPSNQLILVSQDFESTNNTIANIFSTLPSGTLVYLWNTTDQNYTTIAKSRAGWGTDGTNVIQRGVGVFISLPANFQTNMIMSGTVPLNPTTTVFTVNGYAAISYPYPASIPFTNTAVAKKALSGDIVSFWNNGWTSYSKSRAGWGVEVQNVQVNIGTAFFFKSTLNGQSYEECPYTINQDSQ